MNLRCSCGEEGAQYRKAFRVWGLGYRVYSVEDPTLKPLTRTSQKFRVRFLRCLAIRCRNCRMRNSTQEGFEGLGF